MMLVYRFVRLIEERSDALANGLLHKVQRSSRTEAYHNVPPDELKQRVYEITAIWESGCSARVKRTSSSAIPKLALAALIREFLSAS